jgi:ribosomal protein S18 acetylase RimI-like enzyme
VTDSHGCGQLTIRSGVSTDIDSCVQLWVTASAARDGHAVVGVAERFRPKFEQIEAWFVAERPSGALSGFVLATPPGGGPTTDPPTAPVIGPLAVEPSDQGNGVGSRLLSAITSELANRGHDEAVLHVLMDNAVAVHLYESAGWVPAGEPFEHSLLRRPFQTYLRKL